MPGQSGNAAPFNAKYFLSELTPELPNGVIGGGGTITQIGDVSSGVVAFEGTVGTLLEFIARATPSTPGANHSKFYFVVTQGHTRPVILDDDGIEFTMIRDNVFIARNTSGATITKGQAVYISGSTGNVPNIALAKADSLTTLPAVGLAAEDISNNLFGNIIVLGHLTMFDTSAFSSGNRLYVSAATAGALTATRPVYPNFAQRMGSVMVSGVGNGSVHITTAPFIGGEESGTNAANFTFADTVTITNNLTVNTINFDGFTLKAGSQEAGAAGTRFACQVADDYGGSGCNFKATLANVPSSITITRQGGNNDKSQEAINITNLGFTLSIRGTLGGGIDTYWLGRYDTVGN